jgi:hypothetical protein
VVGRSATNRTASTTRVHPHRAIGKRRGHGVDQDGRVHEVSVVDEGDADRDGHDG